MSRKTLVFGLALSGSVLGLMWATSARGQSALAQQEADQEKAAQQGAATSSTNAGTAKPDATAAPGTKPTATAKSDATTAKPAATAPKASTGTASTAKPATSAASTPTAAKAAPVTKPTAAKSDVAKAAPANLATKSPTPKSAAAKPAAAKPAAVKKAPAKPVAYVGDGADGGVAATASGGDSKSGKTQNREMVKAFEQSCPDVTLTEEKAKAGYNVSLEREPGSKGVKTVFGLTNVVHKTNRIEVTSKSGKEVFSESGHSTNQLVKDACAAMATPAVTVAKN
jgi:hypothetical protein